MQDTIHINDYKRQLKEKGKQDKLAEIEQLLERVINRIEQLNKEKADA